MNVIVYKNYEELSEAVAEKILVQISSKPDSVFCLASGNSTELCYQILVKKIVENSVDISKCSFVGLDEWVGIPPTNSGSCRYFFDKHLFGPLSVDSSQIIVFDGMSNDLEEECKKMDAIIKQKGGIDFMIVGVGMNGHIGFNEPGVSVDYYSHVIKLDEVTQSVGQKYFDTPTKLQNGITLGLKYFLESKTAVMMANGAKKADIIKKTLEGKVDVTIPSTIIQKHQNALVAVDEEAYGNNK
jgi:galactosamine-6-phosphate isomerase